RPDPHRAGAHRPAARGGRHRQVEDSLGPDLAGRHRDLRRDERGLRPVGRSRQPSGARHGRGPARLARLPGRARGHRRALIERSSVLLRAGWVRGARRATLAAWLLAFGGPAKTLHADAAPFHLALGGPAPQIANPSELRAFLDELEAQEFMVY